jgi:transposase
MPQRFRAEYPAEFRSRMVELVRSGKSPEALAKEFEPTAQTIRNWLAQADRDEGRRSDGLTTAERDDLIRLKRENRQLREEREILKNSLAAAAACGARNSVSNRMVRDEGSGRVLFGAPLSPLKNVVRGWSAHLAVVTPAKGDPV